MDKIIKTAIIQLHISDDIEKNKAELSKMIEQAASQSAQLIVLSELHNTPYFCQTEDVNNFDLAEPIPAP